MTSVHQFQPQDQSLIPGDQRSRSIPHGRVLLAYGFEDQHFFPAHADGIGKPSGGAHLFPPTGDGLGSGKALFGAHGSYRGGEAGGGQ